MKKLLIALLFAAAILMFSCTPKYTEQKAIAQVDKANDNFPKPVADWLRYKYPCIPLKAKPDSVDYKRWQAAADSLKALYDGELNKLPEVVHITDTVDCVEQCNKKIDELKKTIWLKDDYIVKLQNQIKNTKAVHDTVPIEDSAKIKSLTIVTNDQNKFIIEQNVKIEN